MIVQEGRQWLIEGLGIARVSWLLLSTDLLGQKSFQGKADDALGMIFFFSSISRFSWFCKKSHQVIYSLPSSSRHCPSVPLRQNTQGALCGFN